jgi:hypothetical protein
LYGEMGPIAVNPAAGPRPADRGGVPSVRRATAFDVLVEAATAGELSMPVEMHQMPAGVTVAAVGSTSGGGAGSSSSLVYAFVDKVSACVCVTVRTRNRKS